MRGALRLAGPALLFLLPGCTPHMARLDRFPTAAAEERFRRACAAEPRAAFDRLTALLAEEELAGNILVAWQAADLARRHGWEEEARRRFAALPPAPRLAARARLEEDPRERLGPAEEAIGEDPLYYPAWYIKGRAWLELGEEDEAEKALARAHALCPTWPPAIFDLGQARLLQGRKGEAARLFALYLQRRPGDRPAAFRLLHLLVRMPGREGEARRLLARLRREEPEDREAAFLAAVLLDLEGRHEEAARGYAELAGPGDYGAAAAFNLGWLRLKKLDDPAGALAAFRTYLDQAEADSAAAVAERLQARLHILQLRERGVGR